MYDHTAGADQILSLREVIAQDQAVSPEAVCISCNLRPRHRYRWKERSSECLSCMTKDMRMRNKRLMVATLGYVCSKCGARDDEQLTFEFHHTRDKKETISRMLTGNMERLEQEVEKCELLCQRCHHEHHYPLRDSSFIEGQQRISGRRWTHGECLRALAFKSRLSLVSVAHAAGLPESVIDAIVYSDQSVTPAIAEKLSRVFYVHPDYWMRAEQLRQEQSQTMSSHAQRINHRHMGM